MRTAVDTIDPNAETEKKKRPEFDLKTAVDSSGNSIPLSDKGCLTAIPANWSRDFQPLGRQHFANKIIFLNFRLEQAKLAVTRATARVGEIEEEISSEKNGITPEAKKRSRLAKLEKELAKLKAELVTS